MRKDMFCGRERQNPQRFEPEVPDKRCCLFGIQETFRIRELIQSCQKSLRRPAPQRDFIVIMDHKNRFPRNLPRFLHLLHRKRGLRAMHMRKTGLRPRTFLAKRHRIRKAHRRAEVHQCLIEIARTLLRH